MYLRVLCVAVFCYTLIWPAASVDFSMFRRAAMKQRHMPGASPIDLCIEVMSAIEAQQGSCKREDTTEKCCNTLHSTPAGWRTRCSQLTEHAVSWDEFFREHCTADQRSAWPTLYEDTAGKRVQWVVKMTHMKEYCTSTAHVF